MGLIKKMLNTPTKRLIFVFTVVFVLIALYCQFARVYVKNDRYELSSLYKGYSISDESFHHEIVERLNLTSQNAIITPPVDVVYSSTGIYKHGIIRNIPTNILVGRMCLIETDNLIKGEAIKKTYGIYEKRVNLSLYTFTDYLTDKVNQDQVCWYPKSGIQYRDDDLDKTRYYSIGVLIDGSALEKLNLYREAIDKACDKYINEIRIFQIAQFLLISFIPLLVYIFWKIVYRIFAIVFVFIKYGRFKV